MDNNESERAAAHAQLSADYDAAMDLAKGRDKPTVPIEPLTNRELVYGKVTFAPADSTISEVIANMMRNQQLMGYVECDANNGVDDRGTR